MATLAQLQTDLESVENAIRTIVSGGLQEYTLDTGQSRQTVKKLTLSELRSWKGQLEAEIASKAAPGGVYWDTGY